jgi:hypothetical protein
MSTVAPAKERLWIPVAAILISAPIFGFLFTFLRGAPLIFVPIGVGVCASFLLMYSLWEGQIHDRILGLALGVLFILLTYVFYQITSYLAFRAEQVSLIEEAYGLSRAESAAVLDDELIGTTGAGGIAGYYRLMLNMGIRLESPIPTNNQQVSGLGVLYYGGLELAMLAITILSFTWTALQRPFCVHCNRYYGHMNLRTGKHGLERVGVMDHKQSHEFVKLLKADHLDQAGTMLKTEKIKASHADVLIERCPTCDTNPMMLYVYRKAGQNSPVLIKPLSRPQYDQLTAFAQVGAPQPIGGVRSWMLGMTILGGFFVGLLLVMALLSRT